MIGKFQTVQFVADDLCVQMQRTETEVTFTIPVNVDETLAIKLPVELFTKTYRASFHNERPEPSAKADAILQVMAYLLKELVNVRNVAHRDMLEKVQNEVSAAIAELVLGEEPADRKLSSGY